MATTTTNYGWDIPQSTDLVKDGATAIATLGQDIDTSVYTALGGNKSGMVHLSTVAFSAVASQSFNDVFSATYDYYKMIGFAISSTSASLNFRLRVAGSDASTGNYDTQRLEVDSTSVAGLRASAQTSAQFSAVRSTANGSFEMTLFNPFATEETNFVTQGFDPVSNALLRNMVGRFNLTTSFTGITVLTSSGTMTGSISVFGVNK